MDSSGRDKDAIIHPTLTGGDAKVIDGYTCVLADHSLLTIRASMGADTRHLHSRRIFIDTCSGWNVIRYNLLPPGWEEYLDDAARTPRLANANGKPLPLIGVVNLVVRLGNVFYRIPFIVSRKLSVGIVLGLQFLRTYTRRIDFDANNIVLQRGRPVPFRIPNVDRDVRPQKEGGGSGRKLRIKHTVNVHM